MELTKLRCTILVVKLESLDFNTTAVLQDKAHFTIISPPGIDFSSHVFMEK